MRNLSIFLIIIHTLLLLITHTNTKKLNSLTVKSYEKDPSTYSNYEEIQQTSVFLNLYINFQQKILSGSVTITFTVIKNNVNKLILDVNSLSIKSITKGLTILKFSFDDTYSDSLGQGLVIILDRTYKQNEKLSIVITYSTTEKGDAVQFLSPEMTSDPTKGKPFMFTQCESVSTRSLVPIQDTPANKITVQATLTASSEFEVLFGGIKTNKVDLPNGLSVHYFTQNIPIPPYLIAITAGEIVGRDIINPYNSIKIRVWSEPINIDCTHLTFNDPLPLYVKAASEYMFDYEWGSYELVILPKSFPFGGMENPNLTFSSPSLIHCFKNERGELVADKGQVFIAAHELAHSWTGNLVTNSNWNHFWLNEGFTVFFERKLIELTEGYEARLLGAELVYPSLLDDIRMFILRGNKDLTRLLVDIQKRNPEEIMSKVPYDKGYALLHYLEQSVIKDEKIFQRIFRSYIVKYKYKSVVTSDFIDVFNSEIEEIFKSDQERLKEIKSKLSFNEWVLEEGEPVLIQNDYSNSLSSDCKVEFKYFLQYGKFSSSFESKFNQWTSLQKESFLLLIRDSTDSKTSTPYLVNYLRNTLNIKNEDKYAINIRFRWLQIELKNGKNYEVAEYLSKFLGSIGRSYFVRNIYDLWMRIDKNQAYNDFLINKTGYHPSVVSGIQHDFDLV